MAGQNAKVEHFKTEINGAVERTRKCNDRLHGSQRFVIGIMAKLPDRGKQCSRRMLSGQLGSSDR
jgi:hypothetical protein